MGDNELSQSDIDALFPGGGDKDPDPSTEPDANAANDTNATNEKTQPQQEQPAPDSPTSTQTMEKPEDKPVAQPVQFGQLQKKDTPQTEGNIGFLLDVPVSISVELGRTSMFIKNVLNLGVGSVVELNKLAGEPVDLLINGKLVARGEVVVINENFGVKIIDIISPEQRIKNLN